MRIKLLSGGLILLFLTALAVAAEQVELNPKHPERYTVVKGDTLWDIAGRFLAKPWQWPDVWKTNPQIKNPHLIYPGDVIVLSYRNGAPQLHVERGGAAERGSTVKLSPKVRVEPLEQAIPTLPLNAIQAFLTQTRVVDKQEMETAPYIVASAGEHLISGPGGKIYARGFADGQDVARFGIFRLGEPYRDPDAQDNAVIGYEGIYVGEARMEKPGDPASLVIARAVREVLNGDRLLALEDRGIEHNFLPHAPAQPVEGRILSVVGGVTRIGQYNVVALNLGKQNGMEVGHVLAAYQSGDAVRDTVSGKRGERVQLPDERAGLIMVFRVFERMSYALVMEANGPIRLHDAVKNP